VQLGEAEAGGRERFFRDYWLDQRAKLDLSLPPREEPAGGRQLRSSAQAATGSAAEVDEEGSAGETWSQLLLPHAVAQPTICRLQNFLLS
jgi:hypothetical protein